MGGVSVYVANADGEDCEKPLTQVPISQLTCFWPFAPKFVSGVKLPPTACTRNPRVITYHSTPIGF